MNPKEKAQEMYNKYWPLVYKPNPIFNNNYCEDNTVRLCRMVAHGILNNSEKTLHLQEYWHNVHRELGNIKSPTDLKKSIMTNKDFIKAFEPICEDPFAHTLEDDLPF